ncbi:integrin alpha [Nonomuraea sp. NPDC052129]|uniref:integrin alpha n=1 Tax=Nonomuraea sp. NPDC052129 TaxID=3154651 RepID=UPI003430CC15
MARMTRGRPLFTRLLTAVLLVVTACSTTPPSSPQAQPTAGDCSRASARDFDGDGRDDVAVSRTEGESTIYLLTAGKLVPLPVPGSNQENGGFFGWALTLAHVNGDRCIDVVVGAPGVEIDGKEAAGAVFVYYGGDFAPPQRLIATKPHKRGLFGSSLAAHGDLLAIGSPGAANGGAVYLARNGTLIRSISQDSEGIPGNGERLDSFGERVALGPLASGKVGLIVGAPGEIDDGPGQQEGNPDEEAGAVTVIHDVTAAKPAATRLKHPTAVSGGLLCVGFGSSLAYVRGIGLAATGSDCDRIQFYGLDLQPMRTVLRPPGANVDSGARLAASERGQVAALWINPGGLPTLQVLSTTDSLLPSDRLQGSFGVTFGGDRIMLGSIGGPYSNVAVVDPSTGRTQLIKAPSSFSLGDLIAG